MYTAAVLGLADRQRLTAAVVERFPIEEMGFQFQTGRGDPLPHHMTLNLGGFDATLNDPAALGAPAELTIDALCLNEEMGVCAGRVVRAVARPDGREFELRSANDHPHVTICLKSGSKPALSNRLAWTCEGSLVYLPEPITVSAVVEEC